MGGGNLSKGFAISGVLYPILILVIFLMAQILSILGTRKVVLDQNNKRLLEAINSENKVYTNEELSELLDKLMDNVYTKKEVDSFMKGVQKEYSKVIDLRDSSYNINTWYPVVGRESSGYYQHLRCVSFLQQSGTPSWAAHANGFTVNVELLTQLGSWGNRPARTIVFANEFKYIRNDVSAVGFRNLDEVGNVFYLRGGGKYFLYSYTPIQWNVYTSKFFPHEGYPDIYVEPLSSNPGITATNGVVTIK